jgi:hypothetical protein
VVEAVADTTAAAYPEAGRFEASQVAWRVLHAALDAAELLRMSDPRELAPGSAGGYRPGCSCSDVRRTKPHSMRLRLGSASDELVALRQAAMAVADTLTRAA